MKFNDMVKSRRYGKSVKKNYELLDILPDTLDICGNTFELSRSSYMDDMGGGSSIYYSWDDYTFDFYGEEEYLILKLYKLEYDDDPEYPEAWNEELATVEEDLSHPWNTIEEMRGVMESMFNQYANKSTRKMKKSQEWYCGVEGVWEAEINGDDCLRAGTCYYYKSDVEKTMEEEYYDRHPDFEDYIDEDELHQFIHDNPTIPQDLVRDLASSGCAGGCMSYAVVVQDYHNGETSLYIMDSEEDAKTVYDILCDLDDNGENAELDFGYIEPLITDVKEHGRYRGESEIDDCIIYNTTHTPYVW